MRTFTRAPMKRKIDAYDEYKFLAIPETEGIVVIAERNSFETKFVSRPPKILVDGDKNRGTKLDRR